MNVAEFIEWLKTQDQSAEVRVLCYDRSDVLGSHYEFKPVEPGENAFGFEKDGKRYIDFGQE